MRSVGVTEEEVRCRVEGKSVEIELISIFSQPFGSGYVTYRRSQTSRPQACPALLQYSFQEAENAALGILVLQIGY